MQNYLNRRERENHMLILVMWDRLSEWARKSNHLAPGERTAIRQIAGRCLALSDRLVARMPDEYARTLLADVNRKEIVLRDAHTQNRISAAPESIECLTDYVQAMQCFACERDDFVRCPYYAALNDCTGKVRSTRTSGCPYRQMFGETEDGWEP